jgi:hypothetical protein
MGNKNITRKPLKGLVRPEVHRSGRNRRNSPAGHERNRQFSDRLGASRLDSLHREVEDDEVVPTVAAARLGVDGAGGAMVVL